MLEHKNNMQTTLAQDIVGFGAQQTSSETIKYQINHNLQVNGNLIVKGTTTFTELAELQTENTKLLNANKQLQERMDEIEKRLDMLWFAPGMPGFEMSKSHYNSIIE